MRIGSTPPSHACNALAYDLLREALGSLECTAVTHSAPSMPAPSLAPVPVLAPEPVMAEPLMLRESGGRPRYWTSETVAMALHAFVQTQRRVPTNAEWRQALQHGLPDPGALRRFWGSREACYLALNLIPNAHVRGEHWTATTATAALQAFVATHGRMPRTTEWRQSARHGLPDEQFIRVVWGTYGVFFQRAGLTPYPRGVRQASTTRKALQVLDHLSASNSALATGEVTA